MESHLLVFSYVFPIKELEQVMVDHDSLDLNLSYEENMKIKAERKARFKNNQVPNIEQEPKIDDNQRILNLLNSKEASLTTPPLPLQPAPKAIQTTSAPVNQATGLTSTETALLSPNEQAIRLKQRGIA
jgi:hypothetical protein